MFWQFGQFLRFVMSMVVKVMSLKSHTMNLFFSVVPMPVRVFMVSMAWMAPIMPGVAPITPLVLQFWRSSSAMFGSMHSRHGVSGGWNTDMLPSTPIAAPKTYGMRSLVVARLTR